MLITYEHSTVDRSTPYGWLWILVLVVIATADVRFARAGTVEGGRTGRTIYVSKSGDNSDGSSWAKAFHAIQAGLQAVPDDKGGHRVIIRPDTYAEANIFPSYKGAPGAYNVLMGDADGKLGSGATGWVVVDSGAPEVIVRTDRSIKGGNPPWKLLDTGDPKAEWGFKSIDWWGTFKSNPTYSAEICDRWIFRKLYMCGSEGAGWDLTCRKGAPFSVIMEDCVGVGRFAGVGVGAHVGRPDEPIVFRRNYFMCMDWWGDAAGAYVRAENPKSHDYPDAVFEDCTLVGPDNALQAGNPGFDGYTRVKLKNCRLISLNFSQPHGQPSTGVIYSTIKGKFLHVDIEDSVLMGYKIFGAGGKQYGAGENPDGGPISYTIKGKVQAYVHHLQPVPEGMERLRFWPVDAFQLLLPPGPPTGTGDRVPAAASGRPKLARLPLTFPKSMENTPFIYKGLPLIALNHRDDTKNKTDEYVKSMYLYIVDLRTGNEVARFGEGHSFVSAFVNGEELNVFASEGTNRDWFQSIYRFSTTDMKTWKREPAIGLEGSEHLFNSSVCRDEQGYLMAYESNLPRQWTFKFARSKDLSKWEKVDGLLFHDPTNMCACPVLRYIRPFHYVIYTREGKVKSGQTGWMPYLARSTDLVTWELSPYNPIVEPVDGEGTNNSDVDLFEFEGNTYVYYATGDQSTWGSLRAARYSGSMSEFFTSYFPAGVPTVKVSTK